jgi:DNA-binding beta-propeller fold protein YncE
MQVVDSTKAYVTNMQNYISVLDLKNNVVSGRIQTTSWTERLVSYDHFMLVSSIGKFNEVSAERIASILVIDTRTDAIVDSIESGTEPVGIVIDKKQKVWVLCSGGYDQFEAPSLIRINPELRLVEKIFTFPDKAQIPSRLCINPGGDTLYYLKGDVYQMPVTSAALPVTPLVSADGRLLYGLDIHPVTGKIYVSDAKDYVQNGTACQYTVTGTLVREYPTGRIPGAFCFSETSAK